MWETNLFGKSTSACHNHVPATSVCKMAVFVNRIRSEVIIEDVPLRSTVPDNKLLRQKGNTNDLFVISQKIVLAKVVKNIYRKHHMYYW